MKESFSKNIIVKKFKKYFSTNILFLTYTFTSVLMGFLLRLFTMGNVSDFRAYVCDFIIVIVIGSFGYLIKPKNQFKYFLCVSILFTAMCVINSIYYKFYTNYVSISLLSTLSMLGDVSDSVTSKLKLIHFIYLIGPITLIIVNKLLVKKDYYYKVGKDEKGKLMFRNTCLSGIILVFLIIFTMTKSDGSKLVKLWNRDYVVKRFGIYTYMFSDFVTSVQPAISPMFNYDEDRREFLNFYNSKDYTKKENAYTGVFEGKNVIFIHMESIQNFLIDLRINGIEITPNLNKLVKESMYFSKFYPQISVGTSSDTEFTLSTGLLPSTSGTVFVNYYNRTYETLENAFRSKGYYTFSMHANNGNYWNRKNMYHTLGYDDFYDKDSYIVPTDKKNKDYIGLGLSDKSFYEQIIPIIEDIKNNHNSYMGKVISLSNHSPFNDLSKYGNINFSVEYKDDEGNIKVDSYLEDTEIGNYLKSAHYADEALGVLFKLIKENNLDDNTVFVLYGDHESKLGKDNLDFLYNYDLDIHKLKSKDDATYINLNKYNYNLLKNTPLIIYTKDMSPKLVKDVMGMWDVFPTISNMFGLECKYALGNDIFSDKEKIVVFPNGDIVTNKVYYNNLREEYVSLNGEPINNDYIERIKNYAEVRLGVSKAIIVHDLLYKEGKVERVERNEESIK
ncbi:LTA synthase family protein [uncultured Clostridium sp.]|uniref:LTA synthase family protein n=1 Tax=uncultured Clostridium sp. TaxID=59620 RepID=UPI0025DD5CD5|nr:LTA synthase family protein [uncultured Clostridium sp.]